MNLNLWILFHSGMLCAMSWLAFCTHRTNRKMFVELHMRIRHQEERSAILEKWVIHLGDRLDNEK